MATLKEFMRSINEQVEEYIDEHTGAIHMATLKEFMRSIDEQVEEYIDEHFTEVCPEAVGLDNRSASKLYANREAIVIHDYDKNQANYYGGLEYVDQNFVNTIGKFIIYHYDDSRIQEAIDYLYDGEIEFDTDEEFDEAD